MLIFQLVEEGDCFSMGVPYHFGKNFEKAAKQHIDFMKLNRRFSQLQLQEQRQCFDRAAPTAPTANRLHMGVAPIVEAVKVEQRPVSPICQPKRRQREPETAATAASRSGTANCV